MVRTGVPLVVGVGVSFAAAKGIHISPETEAQVVVLIGAVAASIYHWVVHLLEEHWPRFGWLLGIARSPDYHQHDWDANYESVTDRRGRQRYRDEHRVSGPGRVMTTILRKATTYTDAMTAHGHLVSRPPICTADQMPLHGISR